MARRVSQSSELASQLPGGGVEEEERGKWLRDVMLVWWLTNWCYRVCATDCAKPREDLARCLYVAVDLGVILLLLLLELCKDVLRRSLTKRPIGQSRPSGRGSL